MDNRSTGFKGEDYACGLLKKEGYKILDRNFRTKFGEIDIIAKDGSALVFVEVKTRHSLKYGQPEEAVNRYKISNIKRAAYIYLKTSNNISKMLRIDIVSILVEGNLVKTAKIIKGVA